jgi:signal transduction histidine kinase
MALARRTKPSAYLTILITAVTVVPLGLVSWLGWRLLEQDRLLQHEQVQRRVERAADLAVAALERAVSETEREIAAGRTSWPDGAVALVFDADRVLVEPAGRLAFVPQEPGRSEAPATLFAPAEALEFRGQIAAALRAYQSLSRDANPVVRAGALVRYARAAQNAERDADALDAYARLLDTNDINVNGVPAALVAMFGRCRVFEKWGRTADLQTEATRLEMALSEGRWQLTAPVYWLYVADARRWSGHTSHQLLPSETLASAAAAVYERRRSGVHTTDGSPARELLQIDADTFVVLRQTVNGAQAVLIATSDFVNHHWVPAAATILEANHIIISINYRRGEQRAAVPSTPDSQWQVSRGSTETGLPWSMLAATTLPAPEDRDFAVRRRLLAAGMALLVLMVSAATYVVVRAISREIAVARLQSDFVAAVSHEFRTPLTSLRQFTEMLQEHPELDDERRRLAYEVQSRSTERLMRLVESLLDFGRLEAGAPGHTLAIHDCTRVVSDVVDEVRAETAGTGRRIELHASSIAPGLVDRDALSRAVRNLLDNAVKYSPEREPISVAITVQSREIAISVADRGIGIPAHEHKAVFSKFHRGAQARLQGIKGTGIGLTLVSEIVSAQGGRVELVSAENVGSTFTIFLPLGSAPAQEPAMTTPATWPES